MGSAVYEEIYHMESRTPEDDGIGSIQKASEIPKRKNGLLRWFGRTPVQTFILCPTAVLLFELMFHRGSPYFVIWGLPLLVWGYLQYRYVGQYRHPRAGGTSGMDVPPDRVIDTGPYRFTRNPMYLGHLIFLTGLAVTLWSWFAVLILVGRGIWFHRRVLHDEQRLQTLFGEEYAGYRRRVKRWIPGVI
jgi:protein-S-isoprenylcysteine O-methyltransferase Ste14